ncbi:hypothetical protein CHARACLAT_014675 [Characodon lateralis]|uniref:Uncharacterized protein n=1 Tax=Characodon lateralis TaxID=208331 RepID=A0ABU7EMQ1_9TELE|nr:hypothetical protein [Characodon lateralis]
MSSVTFPPQMVFCMQANKAEVGSELTRTPFSTCLLCPLHSLWHTANKTFIPSTTIVFLPHFHKWQISEQCQQIPHLGCSSEAPPELPWGSWLPLQIILSLPDLSV